MTHRPHRTKPLTGHTYSVPVVRENLPPARISQRALVLASLVAGERPVREA